MARNQLERLVIVGATGYIGGRLLAAASSTLPAIGTSSRGGALLRLDLSRPREFDYSQLRTGDAVILCAGISSPDFCAREHVRAWALNVEGTAQFMHRAIERGADVVFFSSDTVYGERDSDFDEAAPSSPAGEYAEMKLEVERRFDGHPQVRSLRLSYVFSRDDKFTSYLRGCAGRGDQAEIFHPFYRAVVHRDDVVQGVLALARRWDELPGSVINFGGPEVISRKSFAATLKDTALPGLQWRGVEPAAGFFANRPRVIRMRSPRLATLLGRPALSLREAARVEFDGKIE